MLSFYGRNSMIMATNQLLDFTSPRTEVPASVLFFDSCYHYSMPNAYHKGD